LTLVAPGTRSAARLSEAVAGRAVYVHLDCDVLDPGIVPTDYQVPHGLSQNDLYDAATALAHNDVIGLEIAELESATGDEDLAPLLRALALLDALSH
jgi:arginase